MTKQELELTQALLSVPGAEEALADWLLEQQKAYLIKEVVDLARKAGENRTEILCFHMVDESVEAYWSPHTHFWRFIYPDLPEADTIPSWLLVTADAHDPNGLMRTLRRQDLREALQEASLFWSTKPVGWAISGGAWGELPAHLRPYAFIHQAGLSDGTVIQGPALAAALALHTGQYDPQAVPAAVIGS